MDKAVVVVGRYGGQQSMIDAIVSSEAERSSTSTGYHSLMFA